MLAKYLKQADSEERIAIIPTDEERIKVIIVPVSLVKAELEQTKSMQKVVRDVLSNIDTVDTDQIVSMMIPSFNLNTVIELPELVGAQLTRDKKVAAAHMAVNINLIKGRY